MVRYCGGLYLVSVVLLGKSWKVLGDDGVVGHGLRGFGMEGSRDGLRARCVPRRGQGDGEVVETKAREMEERVKRSSCGTFFFGSQICKYVTITSLIPLPHR